MTASSRTTRLTMLVLVPTLTLTTTLLLPTLSRTNLDASKPDGNDDDNTDAAPDFQMDIDFMDKLANKPYLMGQQQHYGGSNNNNTSNTSDEGLSMSQRPASVPQTLRIIAVDVDLSGAFRNGTCEQRLDKVYPHGMAKDRKVMVANSDKEKTSSQMVVLSVEQKAWVTSLMECVTHSDKVGVQVLQANTQDLNHHRLERPAEHSQLQQQSSVRRSNNPKRSALSRFASKERLKRRNSHYQTDDDERETKEDSSSRSLSLVQQELSAPWNQYAWKEEVQLRLSGSVEYTAVLQPARWWQRWVWGSAYQPTVQSESWFRNINPVGKGNSMTHYNHQPHAVIVNGATLQHVPHALRFLQTTCQANNIPLFVLYDPRPWKNTHQNLSQVLKQVRKRIKHDIIAKSLQNSTAFARGRLFGQVETQVKWKSQEVLRKSRERLKEAQEAATHRKEMDWRHLTVEQLEDKLYQRGVLDKTKNGKFLYSQVLLLLARKCLGPDESMSSSVGEDDDTDER